MDYSKPVLKLGVYQKDVSGFCERNDIEKTDDAEVDDTVEEAVKEVCDMCASRGRSVPGHGRVFARASTFVHY